MFVCCLGFCLRLAVGHICFPVWRERRIPRPPAACEINRGCSWTTVPVNNSAFYSGERASGNGPKKSLFWPLNDRFARRWRAPLRRCRDMFLVPKMRSWERKLPGQLHCVEGGRFSSSPTLLRSENVSAREREAGNSCRGFLR
jgi:hypothetical protein